MKRKLEGTDRRMYILLKNLLSCHFMEGLTDYYTESSLSLYHSIKTT
jgi:hypothetical protein